MEWALELDGAQWKRRNKDDKLLPDVQVDTEKAELTWVSGGRRRWQGWAEAGEPWELNRRGLSRSPEPTAGALEQPERVSEARQCSDDLNPEASSLNRVQYGTPLQYSCLENPMDGGAWWAAVHGVAKSRTRLGDFTFTFHFHTLEEEMETHSSVLAWRIPGTGEPGGLPSMGSHRVGHDWSDLAAAAATCLHFVCFYVLNSSGFIFLHSLFLEIKILH